MIDVLGSVATLLTVAFPWPQAWRAVWRGQTAGIHWGSTAISAWSGWLWALYGIGIASPYVAVANVSLFVACLVTAYALRSDRVRLGWAIGSAVGVGTALRWGVGLDAVAWVGIVAGGLLALPQAIAVWRVDPDSHGLDGVSIPSYALLSIVAACWMAYGFALGDPLVVAPNFVSLPCAVAVVWRLRGRTATRP